MTDPIQAFQSEVAERVRSYRDNEALLRSASEFMLASTAPKYSYNFAWLGRPIIQYPQDIVAVQELVWRVRPDLIIETGIAHGGSLILSASMLAMLDYCDCIESGVTLDPVRSRRRVLGIDIDIRAHNRAAITSHPMAHRIDMIEGSSVAKDIIERVHEYSRPYERIMVMLDSNHTHEHVLAELEAYAPLTSPGSYCIVFDTVVEDISREHYPDRPWGPGNSPKSALRHYVRSLSIQPQTDARGRPLIFEIDESVDNKLLVSVAPEGYLRRPMAG